MNAPLAGWTVAVPESRQLDVLAGLLSRRGAALHRCPLVGIVDAPDEAPIIAWWEWLVHQPPAYLIFLTGEGVTRLRGFAHSAGISDETLRDALSRTEIVSRGPKPARALRELDLQPTHYATTPTTDGVIETLRSLPLANQSVAVQLYGDDPNVPLMRFLNTSAAIVAPVSPYRYARDVSDAAIVTLIDELADGAIDAIVFTSMAQVKRLIAVADSEDRAAALASGLSRTVVAAVGPVVADLLRENGIAVDVMPASRYFMKPLVSALVAYRQSSEVVSLEARRQA
ncbi:MAG: uroporphyrinogen-III synthase [Pseudomonadota bacterium]